MRISYSQCAGGLPSYHIPWVAQCRLPMTPTFPSSAHPCDLLLIALCTRKHAEERTPGLSVGKSDTSFYSIISGSSNFIQAFVAMVHNGLQTLPFELHSQPRNRIFAIVYIWLRLRLPEVVQRGPSHPKPEKKKFIRHNSTHTIKD